jgi:hypothetical protein
MLLLFSATLFGFGLLLFALGLAVWLIGLALRVAIRLFQLGLLIVWAGVIVYSRLRHRPKVTVLEGEILPPERRALPGRKYIDMKLLIIALVLSALSLASMMHSAHTTSCWTIGRSGGHSLNAAMVGAAPRAGLSALAMGTSPNADDGDHSPAVIGALWKCVGHQVRFNGKPKRSACRPYGWEVHQMHQAV